MLEFAQFLVNYALGDDARAAHHAGMLTDEVHPFVLVARALVAIRAGDRPRAQQHRSTGCSRSIRPGASARAARSSATSPAAEIVDRMIRDLSPSGSARRIELPSSGAAQLQERAT